MNKKKKKMDPDFILEKHVMLMGAFRHISMDHLKKKKKKFNITFMKNIKQLLKKISYFF